MGSSESTAELLEVPLHSQSPPVLAISQGSVASAFTSLCVTRESTWRSTLQVVDAATQQRVFEFKFPSFSSRCILQTPDGRALATIKSKSFSSGYRVYEGEQCDTPSFEMRVEGFHSVIFADFQDRLSGRQCRVLLDDHVSKRVVLFYLEYGYPTLPPKPRRDDVANGHRFQVVGRIREPHGKVFAEQQYYVEAAPGIDITVLLMLWRVREQLQENRRNSNNTASVSSG